MNMWLVQSHRIPCLERSYILSNALELRDNFEKEAFHFHFALGPSNCVASSGGYKSTEIRGTLELYQSRSFLI